MIRRLLIASLGLAAVAFPSASRAQGVATTPLKESGNPINDQGSNYDYRSTITAVVPSVPGLQLEVLEFADRLVLRNHTGKTVTVYGYQHEPYARVLADGEVQVNTTSPAYFLNQNFYGDVNVPSYATATTTPHWEAVDRTGELEWHDHRIHWMSPVLPPEVKDKSKRTKIFDWQVPIAVGTEPATIDGQLYWVPEEGTKTPTAAIVVLVVIVLAGIAFVAYVRRRRRSSPPPAPSPREAGAPGGRDGAEDAW
jgi:hypothetical protein